MSAAGGCPIRTRNARRRDAPKLPAELVALVKVHAGDDRSDLCGRLRAHAARCGAAGRRLAAQLCARPPRARGRGCGSGLDRVVCRRRARQPQGLEPLERALAHRRQRRRHGAEKERGREEQGEEDRREQGPNTTTHTSSSPRLWAPFQRRSAQRPCAPASQCPRACLAGRCAHSAGRGPRVKWPAVRFGAVAEERRKICRCHLNTVRPMSSVFCGFPRLCGRRCGRVSDMRAMMPLLPPGSRSAPRPVKRGRRGRHGCLP